MSAPATAEELAELIESLVAEPGAMYKLGMAELVAQYGSEDLVPLTARPENAMMTAAYNRVAEVLVEVAEAAFNFAAREMGPTGAQAGFAALRLLGNLQDIKGPFMVVRAENSLYPQYDGQVKGWLEGSGVRQYLHQRALDRLAEAPAGGLMGDRVRQRLAELGVDPDAWEANP